jgi:hypothetical protein
MTLPATTRSAGPYVGNGVTTAFPFAFKVFAGFDLVVIKTFVDGTQSTLALGGDYSVALNPDQDAAPGGTITFPISGAPLAIGETLAAIGGLPYNQTLDLPPGGNFNPTALENALDRSTMQIQQVRENAGRTITAPPGETLANLPSAASRANRLLSFDSTGQIVTVAPAAGDAASLAIDLASTALASKNAGQVGFNSALGYGAGTVGLALTAAGRAGFRNKIINGGFDIWQRATAFTSGVLLNTYTADRWIVYAAGAAVTVTRNTGLGYTVGTDCMLLTGAAGNTQVDLRQRFEAKDVAKWRGGPLTLTAKIYNATGSTIASNSIIFTVSTPTALDNWTGATQQLGTTFTHAAIPNNSWAVLTVTFNPSGYTNTSFGMDIGLRLPSGLGAGQLVNWSEIQLETGSVATPFEHRQLGLELALCQQYCLIAPLGTYFGTANPSSATAIVFYVPTPVPLRASTPSVTGFSGTTTFAATGVGLFTSTSTPTVDGLGVNMVVLAQSGYTGLTVGRPGSVYHSAAFTLSAEL